MLYKQELQEKVMKRHKEISMAGTASLDDTPHNSLHRWCEQDMGSYVSSGWNLGRTIAGPVILQLDGTRLGNPAKETINYILRDSVQNIGCILPPQVVFLCDLISSIMPRIE